MNLHPMVDVDLVNSLDIIRSSHPVTRVLLVIPGVKLGPHRGVCFRRRVFVVNDSLDSGIMCCCIEIGDSGLVADFIPPGSYRPAWDLLANGVDWILGLVPINRFWAATDEERAKSGDWGHDDGKAGFKIEAEKGPGRVDRAAEAYAIKAIAAYANYCYHHHYYWKA